MLLKVAQELNDMFAYIVSGLFALMIFVFFISKMKAPLMIPRTLTFAIVTLYLLHIIPSTFSLLVAAYLAAGIIVVYTLGKQLQWWFTTYFTQR
jgi:hypothetical protein